MSNNIIPIINIDILKQVNTPYDSIIIYILPLFIIFIVILIVFYYLMIIEFSVSKLNWEINKCIPKYMFFSGFIQKEENEGILGTINKTFKKCVNRYYVKKTTT
jgi:hypothetical protein